MVLTGTTISFEDFDTTVVEVDWAAQSAGSPLYDEWQVAPAEGDIVIAGVDTRAVTAQYCYDADMLVVPVRDVRHIRGEVSSHSTGAPYGDYRQWQ